MRRAFFLFLLVFVALATAGYIVWVIAQAVYWMWRDRKLYKEMAELEEWARKKRQQNHSSSETVPGNTDAPQK